jgi:acetyl-CoA carboxylase, biotin carboxylase subunit
VDSAIYQGYKIPPFYDSMVGKLIVWALTREEAINRARRALREYRLEGIKTTIPLHTRLLEEDGFRSGEYHTGYLEELLSKKG